MHKNGKTEHRGGRQYGYVRVSSREQNEARQLAAMRNAGIRAEYIFADKQSGRDFDRPQYKRLLRRLRGGDTLFVHSIDRLGRNYHEIIEQWQYLLGYHEGDSIEDLNGTGSGSGNYSEYGYWFGTQVKGNTYGHYYAWCAMFVSPVFPQV